MTAAQKKRVLSKLKELNKQIDSTKNGARISRLMREHNRLVCANGVVTIAYRLKVTGRDYVA